MLKKTKHPTKRGRGEGRWNSAYVIHNLEVLGNIHLKWFNGNSMKAYPGKYHLPLSGSDSSKITVGNKTISSSKCKKLLGIKIDNNLNFKEHIESLCKKVSQKINALSRLASSINSKQRRLIMNSFVICHFSNCPVVSMFHRRKLNACITRLPERALRVVYIDFDSSFEELLRRDSSATLHQQNLQKLMTEIFKVETRIAPKLMKVVFEFTDVPYNLRNQFKCNRSVPCIERYGVETASSIGPKLWYKVPTEMTDLKCELKVRFPKTVLARYIN